MQTNAPKHWRGIDWETKARENPLMAIMTTPEMADAPPEAFPPALLEEFFQRGRKLFKKHVKPLLAEVAQGSMVAEYGCGAGRILKHVAGAGFKAVGVDISDTMLKHCRDLVPEVHALYGLDEAGRSEAPDAACALVFSYAVVQHIDRLSRFQAALDEMCRMLRPGGALAVQVNCEDFPSADPSARCRTENFEAHSLHFHVGEAAPFKRHNQDHWSGVYIGYERLTELLAERGVTVDRWYYHNGVKPRAIWIVGRKA